MAQQIELSYNSLVFQYVNAIINRQLESQKDYAVSKRNLIIKYSACDIFLGFKRFMM